MTSAHRVSYRLLKKAKQNTSMAWVVVGGAYSHVLRLSVTALLANKYVRSLALLRLICDVNVNSVHVIRFEENECFNRFSTRSVKWYSIASISDHRSCIIITNIPKGLNGKYNTDYNKRLPQIRLSHVACAACEGGSVICANHHQRLESQEYQNICYQKNYTFTIWVEKKSKRVKKPFRFK